MRRDIDLAIVEGYSLCNWTILYYLPDATRILAPPFLLQKYDLVPGFPELRRFLDFWVRNIEGPILLVQVSSERILRPTRFWFAGEKMRLH